MSRFFYGMLDACIGCILIAAVLFNLGASHDKAHGFKLGFCPTGASCSTFYPDQTGVNPAGSCKFVKNGKTYDCLIYNGFFTAKTPCFFSCAICPVQERCPGFYNIVSGGFAYPCYCGTTDC